MTHNTQHTHTHTHKKEGKKKKKKGGGEERELGVGSIEKNAKKEMEIGKLGYGGI